MTKNEMLKMIVEGAVVTAEMAEKAAEILAADAKAKEARKGKVSEKEQAKRDAHVALATRVAHEILGADVAVKLTELLGEEVKVQRASSLCRKAVELELAVATDVKVPKKGSVKAYAAV